MDEEIAISVKNVSKTLLMNFQFTFFNLACRRGRELGIGFNPELSSKDNVALNAIVLKC